MAGRVGRSHLYLGWSLCDGEMAVLMYMLVHTLKQILIAIDQLCNAIAWGWADETLSSRAWRWQRRGVRCWPQKLIDTIFFWDENHCRESYESELFGRQLPPELRGAPNGRGGT